MIIRFCPIVFERLSDQSLKPIRLNTEVSNAEFMLEQPPSKPALNKASASHKPELPIAKPSVEDQALAKNDDAAVVALNSTSKGSPENAKKNVDAPTASAKRLRKFGYVAIALALVGSGTAYAFTQVATPELQAEVQEAILPQRQKALPVSRPNDPEVQAFTITRDLFLTNQIFYRKVEALAGVAAAKKTGNSSDESTKKDAASSKASSSDEASKSKANKPAATEKVTASAPPAPAAAQVAFTGTTIDSVLEMRVAVAKDVSAIGFATSSRGTLTDLEGNVLKSLAPETAATAAIDNGLVVDGQPIAGGVFWIYPESGGYVAIGDRWYRGRVLVALRERGLIAVNYVLLGDYLYSVVGSEMSPSWSIESLKAQAVAARSYALTHNIHPASDAYFDLDNTPRFQAYNGVGHEANTTQAAVQATAGEFISHDGGIVESLYAASQDIVDDAHDGSGMSQLGAKDLAEQGYSYIDILAHYYPGTALGRIETDAE